ncbi:MAG TPA: GIY-YIG nuclease family protein [Firmicutes bacterium]|nr:GIY-YIG nuclease family protein [Bacillota bacterium]
MDRKKELKQLYKQMKPEMGIFLIRALDDGKCYLQATANLKGTINGTKFKLEAGCHPNRQLQKAWQEKGAANFTFKVLEQLEYEKDETKTDYSEELAILQMVWEEKLAQEKISFF